jgi:AmmeMemoRadiSam system protein B
MRFNVTRIRQAAVAGAFYDDDKQVLSNVVNQLLAQTSVKNDANITQPKALIVPHAGYIYSGAIAASAYRLLESLRHTIKRVVLLGPVHRVPVHGLALPGVDSFATPLGEIPIDHDAAAIVSRLPQVVVSEQAHAFEHSLEVQLPFLETVLDDFSLLPLAVGNASPEDVAEVLNALWGGPETLIVISSDLSHFHEYNQAQLIDAQTAKAILSLDYTITHEQACGGTPVNGLLLAARQHNLQPHLLDLRNSGDTAGDKSRVVGYASFAFTEGEHHDH